MIITENQRDYLASRFEDLYNLYVTSSLSFPYGLPGWKALTDLDKLCTKLLKLNQLTPLSKGKNNAEAAWHQLLQRLSQDDDGDQNLVYFIRAIPTIVAKMNAEHIYGA